MIGQIDHARAVLLGVGNHVIDRRPLVVTREDQGFLLRPITLQVDNIFLFNIDETVEDAQPGIRLADRFPEIGYRVLASAVFLLFAFRVSCMSIVAFVERQEESVFAIELGRHLDFGIRHGEMDDRAALERQ